MLSIDDIYSKHPKSYVMLGKIVWKDNRIYGTMLYASVAFVGTAEDKAKDIIRGRQIGENHIWLYTDKDSNYVRVR